LEGIISIKELARKVKIACIGSVHYCRNTQDAIFRKKTFRCTKNVQLVTNFYPFC